MSSWYFDKDELRQSASAKDGVPFAAECAHRKRGVRFVMEVGTKMDLGHNTMATGVVFFHRFYLYHSFKSFPKYLTGCCCLFLAGKVEETPKKCRDIIQTAKALLPVGKFKTLGSNPKKEIMKLEQRLLKTFQFDLEVYHPYQFLTKYAKCLKGDNVKLTKMVQMAWTFVNDSLCTTLCLEWEPEIIAISLMHLATKLSKFELKDWEDRTSKHLYWWDMFVEGLNTELLENICHQILDIYCLPSNTAPSSSLGTFVVPKTIGPPQSVHQKLLQKVAAQYMPNSEQDAITKNVETENIPNTSTAKRLLPMLPEINPLPSKIQNVSKSLLHPSNLQKQIYFEKPPLPLSKPPLPLSKPPLPLSKPPLPLSKPPLPAGSPISPTSFPSHPSLPSSKLLFSQGVPWLPTVPTSPGFVHPILSPYPSPLSNSAQTFVNLVLSQPNLSNAVCDIYQPKKTAVSTDNHRKSDPLTPPYSAFSHPRGNVSQQKLQPSSKTHSEIQGSYEEVRQKYADTLAFNQHGSFVGGNYDNGLQHHRDSSSSRYSHSGQRHVDGVGRYYPDPVNQQFGGNVPPNKQVINNQNNQPLQGLPHDQNGQIQKHPYQKH